MDISGDIENIDNKKKGKVMRRILGIALLAAMMVLLGSTAFAENDKPYDLALSWTDDPATSMTVVWREEAQRAACMQVVEQLSYEKSGFAGAVEFPATGKDSSLDGSGAWHYEATATGLKAATAYVYRVGREGGWSEVHSFTTDDPTSGSVVFAYLGDVQPAGDSAEDYANWSRFVQKVYQQHPELRFAVLGGDGVNSGISQQQFDQLFAAAEPVFSQVPLFSTVGNHESNFPSGKPELYLERFAFPRNGPAGFSEEFYSFDAGDCHVLVVNSWIFSGEQKLTDTDYAKIAQWIQQDLASSTADWQVVVSHLPLYAVHSDSNAQRMQTAWREIFEDYGVDLVLEGHQHVYSRSFPLYQGKIDYEKGLTCIMGVSGSKFYDSADETLAERTIYQTANCQLIRTDGGTMTVQTVDADGNELDYVSLSQRSGKQTRLAYITRLWKQAGSPAVQTASVFTDTDAKAMIWAYEKGILLGYGNGLAGPNDLIEDWQIQLIQSRLAA